MFLKKETQFGTKHSRVDQVKFVEDSFYKIWRDMVFDILKAVFHKFYLVHRSLEMRSSLLGVDYKQTFLLETKLKTWLD